MMQKNSEAERKRAENLIWTAAGDYAFAPSFCSFREDGTAESYMNLVIGLQRKWLPEAEPLLLDAADSRRAALLLDALWLGIESYVYARELPERPVLPELRAQHARDFFARLQKLNRQQWMAENKRLLDQQRLRWGAVLNRRIGMVSPDRRALAAALNLSGDLSSREAAEALQAMLQRFFHFQGAKEEKPFRISLSGAEAWLLRRVVKTEYEHTDIVMMRNTAARNGQTAAPGGALREDGKHSSKREAADRDYIEACFGASAYPPALLSQMEALLCRDVHRGCHCWVTDGKLPENGRLPQDSLKTREDSERQTLENLRYKKAAGELPASVVRRLSASLAQCLSELREPVMIQARDGRLQTGKCWRLPILQDPAVFEKRRPERELPLTVTLLLDASASRMQVQEQLCLEAWILAESLRHCQVDFSVLSFRSLRGYTVLQRMKRFQDRDTRQLFHFYTAGWNRDGLGLRLAGEEILREGRPGRHILLVLTDASPDDSVRIAASSQYPLGTAYEGAPAVEDTRAAVQELRQKGFLVYGLFLGRTESMDALQRIYGKDQVRIHRVEQLAEACGRIFEGIVREM